MRLTKQDIENIDNYLEHQGIEFLDIRYELIDHLVNEYEAMEGYTELSSFLRKRTAWCNEVSKRKKKAIHWAYQKNLVFRILNFFKSPLFYLVASIIVVLTYIMYNLVSEDIYQRMLLYIFIGIIVFQFTAIGYQNFRNKIKMKLLSNKYLINILSFPHLFLIFFIFLSEYLKHNTVLLTGYLALASLVNIAALIELTEKKKAIIKEYQFLKRLL